MRLLAVLLLAGCATNQYVYSESESCPPTMDDDQRASGVVRCRAMCSSYARDFASFDEDCKCRCAPAAGQGGYQPRANTKRPGSTQL